MTTKANSLNADQRLKRKKLFDQIFAVPTAVRTPKISAFYTEADLGGVHLQAGFSVSKKKFKRAVDRNKIKRLMREAYRTQRTNLENVLKTHNKQVAVVFVFTFTKLPDFKEIKQIMWTVLAGLVKQFEK
ncbi:MAG TPA: ribonuclease P protein component [Flavobacteriales bacterium]|nr:ribonuclease P protein component [Flavobacteriales bacterium]